jgi:hypothetical protein
MRRVLVGIFVAGLMVVMTASPGSACDEVIVYDDEGDLNKQYDPVTLYPKCQWPDGSPVGSAAFLDVEYVKLSVDTEGLVTVEMKLYGPITANSELPSGVKEVGWQVGVYHEIVHWNVDSYDVAINWRGGATLEAAWEDFTVPDGPDVTYPFPAIPELDEEGIDLMVITLSATQSQEFASCPYWFFGTHIHLEPDNGGGKTYAWWWTDIPDVEDFGETGDMDYPWYDSA